MKPFPLTALLMFFLALSCIKEDRSDCPCYLILDFSQVDGDAFASVGLGLQSGNGFVLEDCVSSDSYSSEHVLKVPRADICLNAYHGASFTPGKGFIVEEGSGYPPLWLYSDEISTMSDSVRDTVRLHKSYSQIQVRMLSDGRPCPYVLGIDGNVCGYTLSGQPADGRFKVNLYPDGEGRCSVRVPRQKDSSLSLSIIDGKDVLRRFALGEYILSSGFDWTKPDLEDMDVTIDFASTKIFLKMKNWETCYCFTVEI